MTTRKVFEVASAGRRLRVAADDRLSAWWPRIAPHVPGAAPAVLAGVGADADLSLENEADTADARRLINAHLHVLHLRHLTLCLHAAVLERPDQFGAVLLLGAHGAGKTLVAIALAERGWLPVAGDVTLLDVRPRIVVRGGTSAFVARRATARRWFPGLSLGESPGDRADLQGRWSGRIPERVPPLAAVLVDVDGDPRLRTADAQPVDEHTARTAWLRASTHLLDRVLESRSVVLRLLEDPDAARVRLGLVDEVAARLPLYTVWGAPQHIATRIEQLTRDLPVTGAVK